MKACFDVFHLCLSTVVGIPGLTYELILLLSFPGCGDEAEAEAVKASQGAQTPRVLKDLARLKPAGGD